MSGVLIRFRVDEPTYEKLEEIAERQGVTVSQITKNYVLDAVKSDIDGECTNAQLADSLLENRQLLCSLFASQMIAYQGMMKNMVALDTGNRITDALAEVNPPEQFAFWTAVGEELSLTREPLYDSIIATIDDRFYQNFKHYLGVERLEFLENWEQNKGREYGKEGA